MIIKLLEQPIIAINEASIAGTVDGVIIKANRVSSIYHRNMENHFAVPIENVIIGSDAVMIQDIADMTLASQSVKPLKSMLEVYNISGKHLGCLHGIEVDEEFAVQYIHTENYRIEMKKAVNYESVIVVDMEEVEAEPADTEETCSQKEPEKVEAVVPEALEENSAQVEALEEENIQVEASEVENIQEEAAISMEIEPDIKWNEENCQPEAINPENSELAVVRTLHHNEEKEGFPAVDAKYAYLCGKKLLESIEIEDAFYDKGTIIDPELIRYAIGNNAIVKVIVNAEE